MAGRKQGRADLLRGAPQPSKQAVKVKVIVADCLMPPSRVGARTQGRHTLDERSSIQVLRSQMIPRCPPTPNRKHPRAKDRIKKGPLTKRGCAHTPTHEPTRGRRGMGVSQLWSWVLLLLSTFFFRGRGGESASSVWLAQRLTHVRKGFCQEGILSGRNFVRKEFCQAGILGDTYARTHAHTHARAHTCRKMQMGTLALTADFNNFFR